MKQLRRSFSRLAGKPCWGVKRGVGSFLTLEIGEPHLHVREPFDAVGVSKAARRLAARRQVVVHGDWHLWIYCCDWRVFDESGRLVGDSSSNSKIDRAAAFLNGQAFVSAHLTLRGLRTTFLFDLGARLETRPFDRKSEQWLLFEPSGRVLTLRADKRYAYCRADLPPEKTRWRSIVEDS